jgi:hypothetical protein
MEGSGIVGAAVRKGRAHPIQGFYGTFSSSFGLPEPSDSTHKGALSEDIENAPTETLICPDSNGNSLSNDQS